MQSSSEHGITIACLSAASPDGGHAAHEWLAAGAGAGGAGAGGGGVGSGVAAVHFCLRHWGGEDAGPGGCPPALVLRPAAGATAAARQLLLLLVLQLLLRVAARGGWPQSGRGAVGWWEGLLWLFGAPCRALFWEARKTGNREAQLSGMWAGQFGAECRSLFWVTRGTASNREAQLGRMWVGLLGLHAAVRLCCKAPVFGRREGRGKSQEESMFECGAGNGQGQGES
eukprot:1140118-Pelagomonas_calceolata.AAC.2